MIKSVGVLNYSIIGSKYYRLVVDVDPEITELARALIPSYIHLNKPKYSPHITVTRYETPQNLQIWEAYSGASIYFEYDPNVKNDETYWWLDVYSTKLCEIRAELGLSPKNRFHMTIGNTKCIS